MSITLALTLAAAVLIPFANINSDMTKYLPDGSRMKQGLDILSTQYTASSYVQADVKVMAHDVTKEERASIGKALGELPSVESVSTQLSEDGTYTLFEVQTPDTIDLVAMARTIHRTIPHDLVVETTQDGATPPISVIVIAALLIILILVVMGQSWLEPFVFLLNVGVAVLLNIGTNALLPSVSITTNYIGAILQLVLSLDFSIVMMNRFRQEMSPEKTSLESMNRAVKRAARPILSSALTTIVGLLMLCFMRLKIGMDMGVVLAKGVFCSLICTFTLMPSLLMLFRNGIERTAKRTFVIPTGRLGNFVTGHKVSMAIGAILVLGLSWFFSRRTPIFFSTKGESAIEAVFPAPNPFVIIYNTADEQGVIAMADTLEHDSCVQTVVSYPSLLKKQYSAEGAVDYIKGLATKFEAYMPSDLGVDVGMNLFSDSTMRIVYYLRSGQGDTVSLTFRELMGFVADDCINNPLLSAYISDDIRANMSTLQAFLNTGDLGAPATTENQEEEPVEETKPVVLPPARPKVVQHVEPASEDMVSVVKFVRLFAEEQPSGDMSYLMQVTDTAQIFKPMRVGEMSDFIGSSHAQTKMVYSFSKSGRNMTPYQYVHFLIEDLFNRESLQKYVSDGQKNELKRVCAFIDYAAQDAYLTPEAMARLLTGYGIPNVTADRVRELAFPPAETELAVQDSLGVETDSMLAMVEQDTMPVVEQKVLPKPSTKSSVLKQRRKSKEEIMGETFMAAMESKQRMTAAEMAPLFSKLGQDIDPGQAELLFAFYGCTRYYDESLTMSTEEILNYIGDTLMADPRLEPFFPTELFDGVKQVRDGLNESIEMLSKDTTGLLVVMTNLLDESAETYAYVNRLKELGNTYCPAGFYMIGQGVMYTEMRDGFSHEMTLVTLLTILAIFLIVVLSFRSIIIPVILITTVLSAVFVNVIFAGLFSGGMLYLAYLIVQSILMGATIDYGILFTNYYREYRRTMPKYEACRMAYKGSIRTICTSGMIMVVAPGVMSLLVTDVAISSIVGCLAIGALVAVVLILVVLPAVLVALDRLVVIRSHTLEGKK